MNETASRPPSPRDDEDALRLLTNIRDGIAEKVFAMLDEDLERLRPAVALALANGASPRLLSPYRIDAMQGAPLAHQGLPPLPPEEAPANPIPWEGPDVAVPTSDPS